MRLILRCLLLFMAILGSAAQAVFGQLPPVKVEPLRPPLGSRDTAACSTAETSSCAQAASKLLPLILGDSPMIENLRRLTDEIGGRVTGTPEMAKAIQWGIAGFRAAGVDVHTENTRCQRPGKKVRRGSRLPRHAQQTMCNCARFQKPGDQQHRRAELKPA